MVLDSFMYVHVSYICTHTSIYMWEVHMYLNYTCIWELCVWELTYIVHIFGSCTHNGSCTCIYRKYTHELIENHNSLGRERPLGLDVKQLPTAQDAFRPIPDLISCAGVTGSVGITRHARATHVRFPFISYSICPCIGTCTCTFSLHSVCSLLW